MASVNKVILVGNLGRDPEMRFMPNGDAVANIALATTDRWKDKTSGEMKEATEWHRLAFFGKVAEIAGNYLKKGSQIYVEGKLRTRKFTDKDGVEKFSTEIVVDQMQMLGGKPAGDDAPRQPAQSSAPRQNASRSAPQQSSMQDMDDDIPFANPYRGKYALAI